MKSKANVSAATLLSPAPLFANLFLPSNLRAQGTTLTYQGNRSNFNQTDKEGLTSLRGFGKGFAQSPEHRHWRRGCSLLWVRRLTPAIEGSGNQWACWFRKLARVSGMDWWVSLAGEHGSEGVSPYAAYRCPAFLFRSSFPESLKR
jgi:hypothetical protein